jgi:RraA family protein
MKRILDIPNRPDPQLVAGFADVATAQLSDSMDRLHAASAELRPMHRGGVLAGPAFTVKTAPGDNLLVHKAIDMAQPGDVIVVDGGGFPDQALIGGIMARWAARRGVAGIVVWGAIRDSEEIAADAFPVYARAITHRGPYKDGPGEINVPVALAGMPVHPGDIVVGDADGIVAVPLAIAEPVLASAKRIREREAVIMQEIERGTLDRAWVAETLRRLGYDQK